MNVLVEYRLLGNNSARQHNTINGLRVAVNKKKRKSTKIFQEHYMHHSEEEKYLKPHYDDIKIKLFDKNFCYQHRNIFCNTVKRHLLSEAPELTFQAYQHADCIYFIKN